MLAVGTPVYTDDRKCELCFGRDDNSAGEHYCRQCHHYLCLRCTLSHGNECVWLCRASGTGGTQWDIYNFTDTRNTCGGSCQNRNDRPTHKGPSSNWYFRQNSPFSTQNGTNINFEQNATDKKTSPTGTLENDYPWLRQHSKAEKESFTRRKGISDSDSQSESSARRSMSSRSGKIVVGETKDSSAGSTLLHCRCHPEMNVENYCREHDALCCEDCLATCHVTCMIQPIDEVAGGIRSNANMAKIVEDTESTKLSCDVAVFERITTVNEMEREIEDLKAQVQQRKYHLAQSECVFKEIEAFKREMQLLNTSIEQLMYIRTNLDLSLHEIKHAISDGNDMLTFVALKLNQDLIVKSRVEIRKLKGENHRSLIDKTRPRAGKGSPGYQVIQSPVCILNNFEKNDYSRHYKEIQLQNMSEKSAKTDRLQQLNTDMLVGEARAEKCAQTQNGSKSTTYSEVKDDGRTGKMQCNLELGSGKSTPQFGLKTVSKKRQAASSSTKSKRDKVITYGLATEFYLGQMTDVLNSNAEEIVRLQTPSPDRELVTSTLSAINCDTVEDDVNENTAMHNSKVETSKLDEVSSEKPRTADKSTDFSEISVATGVSGKTLVKKMKKSDKGKTRKVANLQKQVNANRSSINQKESNIRMAKKQALPEFSNRVEEWIHESKRQGQSKAQTTRRKSIPVIPASQLTFTKESTFIKIPDPNRSISSARSRPADEDIYLHSTYLYIRKPRTKLELKDEQIVRLPTDANLCEVTGIASLPDGRIAVSDYSNRSVKVVMPGSNKAMALVLDEPPGEVTAVSSAILMAVYGLPCEQLIVITVSHELTLTKRLRTGCVCKSLTTYNSHVYLLCVSNYKTEIRILNADGFVSIRLSLGHIIPSPVSIAINPLDGVVFVTDKTRGVCAVDTGREVKRFSDKHVECYHGITTDLNNNVFVCTENPGGIYEVALEGKHLVPVSLGYALEDVKVMCYNSAFNTLIVSNRRTETLQLYKVVDTLVLKNK